MKKIGLWKPACITLVFCAAAAIAASAQALTALYSFDNTDGSDPAGLIQATDGNFYGTTYRGRGVQRR